MSIISILMIVGVTGLWGAYTAPGHTAANVGVLLLTLLLLIVAELLSLRGIPRKTVGNLIIAVLQIGILVCGYTLTYALSSYGTMEAVTRFGFGIISFIGAVYQGPYDIMTFTVSVDVSRPDVKPIKPESDWDADWDEENE